MKTLLRDIKVTFPYVNILFERRRARKWKIDTINELIITFPTVALEFMVKYKEMAPLFILSYHKVMKDKISLIRCQPLPIKPIAQKQEPFRNKIDE